MFWDPSLDPLPVYGVTTLVMGNCGLGIAPVAPEVRDDIVDLLCFIEELPPALSDTYVPWGWSSWGEYADRAREQATAVQPFAYTAHNALRASVMGHEAWERAATPDEVAAMAALLDDALRAGSLGMSSNWFDTDRQRRLVPSRLSDGGRARRAARRHRPPSRCNLPGHRAQAARPARRVGTLVRARHPQPVARRRRGRRQGRGGTHHLVPRRRQRAVQSHARLPDVDRHRRDPTVARDGERPGRREARDPRRPRVARPCPRRVGRPAPRAERLPTATRSTS